MSGFIWGRTQQPTKVIRRVCRVIMGALLTRIKEIDTAQKYFFQALLTQKNSRIFEADFEKSSAKSQKNRRQTKSSQNVAQRRFVACDRSGCIQHEV